MTQAGTAQATEDETTAVLRIVKDITTVPADAWDRCAGTDNPFLSHAFLATLEESGSATARTGWLPQHMVLETEDGAVLGCVPMYLKGHSQGEYVFDHGWAHAYEQAGGRYYPKLQVAVPFTPVTGPRLLLAPDAPASTAETLIAGLEKVAEAHEVATLHVTFPTEKQWSMFGDSGWLQRTGQQYHWQNDGYGSFDDFLTALASRKRKAIKKERRQVAEADVAVSVLTGDDLKSEHWDAFFGFYMDTGSRKWGSPYLTRSFFELIGERMPERIALVMAQSQGHWVAGALNFIGADTLYGRNWGCDRHFRYLHFEACYYRAIDFAIDRGLATVEAGAQGEHKIQRGYMPQRTYSAHLIRDPGLRTAVADYLRRETAAVDWEIEALAEQASPFRRTDGTCADGG